MSKLHGMAKRDARSTAIAATVFLFPAVALLLIYMVYPIIDTFLISRLKWNGFYTAEKINVLGADAVILALGSSPVMPTIKGWERENVISCEEALLGRKPVGERIIVVGGGLVGCEIAYGYAKEGRKVTVVEALDELMKHARFRHIILSYNTDGLMTLGEIEMTMKKYGREESFEVNYIPYRRFKSRRDMIQEGELKEMLIYIQKDI